MRSVVACLGPDHPAACPFAADSSEPDRPQVVKAGAVAPPLRGFGLDGLMPPRSGLSKQTKANWGHVAPPIRNSEAAEHAGEKFPQTGRGVINVAQFLADLYAIARKSIRTDRLPFCLHQYLCFMLFEILGSGESISPGPGLSDAEADSTPAITCAPTRLS